MHSNRKGFTLIELLIVVVIIGILAAIAIPKFSTTKDKAYITAMKSDLKNLSTAEEAFFSDSTRYSEGGTELEDYVKPTRGVTTPVISTGAGFWSATVAHLQLAGQQCSIAINTVNPQDANAGEGEPVCYAAP